MRCSALQRTLARFLTNNDAHPRSHTKKLEQNKAALKPRIAKSTTRSNSIMNTNFLNSNVFASASFDDEADDDDFSREQRIGMRDLERREAVQFAMASFDDDVVLGSDYDNGGDGRISEKRENLGIAQTLNRKTLNVAEKLVGKKSNDSRRNNPTKMKGNKKKSSSSFSSSSSNKRNNNESGQRTTKPTTQERPREPRRMSNREEKKSREVKAVFMGTFDDFDGNEGEEDENSTTRFELDAGDVVKMSNSSSNSSSDYERMNVPRIDGNNNTSNNNNNNNAKTTQKKEAVLLTFLNETRMISEDDDESTRISATNLTKCNDAIRKCTSFEDVLPLVKEMRAFGIVPVEATYVAVIVACRNAGTPERAIEVYDACRTSGIDISKRTMLLTMECALKAKKIAAAMRLKYDIEEKGWTLSPNIFDQLLKCTIDVDMPNENGKGKLSSKDRLVRACVLFEEMTTTSKVEPSPVAFNALLVGAARAREPQLVAQTFDEMTSRGIVPSRETCEIALQALAEGGELAKSLNVFAVMRQSGLAPRKSTYYSLILSCAKAKEPKCDEAFEIFYRLREEGSVVPSRAMFAALIDCAIRAGKESYAFDAFDAMKEANIPPTMAIFNRLIHACGKKGTANGLRDALRLYEYVLEQNAADLRPDVYTYGSLIAACAKVRDASKALSLLDEMLKSGDKISPSTVVFNSCITACGQAGRWEDAQKVFEKMKEEIEFKGGFSDDLYIGRETYGAMLDAALGPGGAEAAVAAVALELGKSKKNEQSLSGDDSLLDSKRVELAINLFQSKEAKSLCFYDDIDDALWKNDGKYDASKFTRTEITVCTLALLKAVRFCENDNKKEMMKKSFANLPEEISINCGKEQRILAVESVARAAGVKCETEEQGSSMYVKIQKASLKSLLVVGRTR